MAGFKPTDQMINDLEQRILADLRDTMLGISRERQRGYREFAARLRIALGETFSLDASSPLADDAGKTRQAQARALLRRLDDALDTSTLPATAASAVTELKLLFGAMD